jgi:hypothetical protein
MVSPSFLQVLQSAPHLTLYIFRQVPRPLDSPRPRPLPQSHLPLLQLRTLPLACPQHRLAQLQHQRRKLLYSLHLPRLHRRAPARTRRLRLSRHSEPDSTSLHRPERPVKGYTHCAIFASIQCTPTFHRNTEGSAVRLHQPADYDPCADADRSRLQHPSHGGFLPFRGRHDADVSSKHPAALSGPQTQRGDGE